MMAIHLDHNLAEKELIEAFRARSDNANENTEDIVTILRGSHKTYKYILITGLLGKACNEKINPISLQAGAPIKGSYDARSLCHKVFVPFERNFLSNALGGSNEPFLNKPARFTHLSLKNAVRNGNDKEILSKLIKVLLSVKTRKEASISLSFALGVVLEISSEQTELAKKPVKINLTLLEIYDFIVHFIDKSFEGETCAIVVGTLERIFHASLKEKFTVVCHKVNQSGASSKEIGDIDVFQGGRFCYSVEVKDKAFTVYDVDHAFRKIIANGGIKGAFIYGPRATHEENEIKIRIASLEREEFFTIFMDIYNYSKFMLFQSNIDNRNAFFNQVISTANEINAKDITKKWMHEVIVELTRKNSLQ